MNNADIGDLTLQFFAINKAYLQENDTLKTMLREQGLSAHQIRTELRRRLRQHQVQKTAFETLVKCSQRIEKILQKDDDLSEKLLKNLAKIQKLDMN